MIIDIDYDKNSYIKPEKIIFDIYSFYERNDGTKIEKGKEINLFKNIIFEGEFLNRQRLNGIIKIYNKLSFDDYEKDKFNILIFESEFKNGEINGKGKEYNNYGELIFSGEYLNGQKLKGKEIKYNHIIFEGEYQNGKRWNGKGKEYKEIEKLEFEDKYFNKYLNLNEERMVKDKEYDSADSMDFQLYKNYERSDGKKKEKKKK